MMQAEDLFRSISDRIHSGENVQTVYGPAESASGRTVIPVAQTGGLLAQINWNRLFGRGASSAIESPLVLRPRGYLIASGDDLRFVSANDRRILALTLLLGIAIGFLLAIRGRRRGRAS